MKRIAALVLSLVLAVSCAAASEEGAEAAQPPAVFDTGYFEQETSFTVTKSDDGQTAFIMAGLPAEQTAFTTPYESDTYVSAVFPDIIVSDYASGAPSPHFRVWIRYRGTRPLNVTSVSFKSADKEYLFTDVAREEWTAVREDGTAAQDLLIVLGSDRNNAECFASCLLAPGMEYFSARYGSGKDNPDATKPALVMVLHGDEEIEAELPDVFWMEMGMFGMALDAVNGFSCLAGDAGTPCLAADLK